MNYKMNQYHSNNPSINTNVKYDKYYIKYKHRNINVINGNTFCNYNGIYVGLLSNAGSDGNRLSSFSIIIGDEIGNAFSFGVILTSSFRITNFSSSLSSLPSSIEISVCKSLIVFIELEILLSLGIGTICALSFITGDILLFIFDAFIA